MPPLENKGDIDSTNHLSVIIYNVLFFPIYLLLVLHFHILLLNMSLKNNELIRNIW